MSIKVGAAPVYHIVEMEMPEGPPRFYASLDTEPPYLRNILIGPFESAERLKVIWEYNRQKPQDAVLAAEVIKSQHYQDKDIFWRWYKNWELLVFFDIPLDEFTERMNQVNSGLPLGPEGEALRNELKLVMQANTQGAEIDVLTVQAEQLSVEGKHLESGTVTIRLPIKANIRFPTALFERSLSYLQGCIFPRLNVPLLGLKDFPGFFYF